VEVLKVIDGDSSSIEPTITLDKTEAMVTIEKISSSSKPLSGGKFIIKCGSDTQQSSPIPYNAKP